MYFKKMKEKKHTDWKWDDEKNITNEKWDQPGIPVFIFDKVDFE